MKLSSDSFPNGARIPARYALGQPDPVNHVTFAQNLNPHLRWSDPPAGTRSFALIFHDGDVPSVGDDVNKEDRTVPHDLPRVDFFHWVLVDIAPDVREIAEGAVSRGLVPRGKPVGVTQFGRAGRNDYTGWFAGDPNMAGEYGGYDGPGPPWNDERIHTYYLKLYALDIEHTGLAGSFGGQEARNAIEGHVLAEAVWQGTYTLNTNL